MRGFRAAICGGLLLRATLAVADSTPVVVAVGVNQSFDARLSPLSYAETDADRFARTMVNVGGVAPANVQLLKSPTADEFAGAVHLLTRAHKDVRLILYFSGHADDRGLHFRNGALGRTELHRLLSSVAATTKISILDSCFSGWVATKGATQDAAFDLPKLDLDELTGSVFLTASSARDVAYESEELSGSVFTHHLITGLNGAGDGNKDGLVTVDELYQYVYRETRMRSGGYPGSPQRPEYHADLHGQGTLVLSRPTNELGILHVDPGIMGSVHLASMSGLGSFTIHGDLSGKKEFKLPSGAYRAVIRRADTVGVADVQIAPHEETTLKASQFAWRGTDNTIMAENTKGFTARLAGDGSVNVASVSSAIGGVDYKVYRLEHGNELTSTRVKDTSLSVLGAGGLQKGKGVMDTVELDSYGANVSIAVMLTRSRGAARALLGVTEALEHRKWHEHDLDTDFNGNTIDEYPYRESNALSQSIYAGALLPIATTEVGHWTMLVKREYSWSRNIDNGVGGTDFLTVGISLEP